MVGRVEEIKTLNDALLSSQSELIAIYGRRRIGKTFLVREHFSKQLIFSMSGLFEATLQEQLNEFASCLKIASKRKTQIPNDWFDAFAMLRTYIESKTGKTKKVIFLDEVPWLSTSKSRFLTAFESFWNGWASSRKDLVVVICGSASSWMIQKIEKSKGGLYNRVTKRIVLKPFTLSETEAFLKSKGINWSRSHITELYMMLGGVPHYLNQVRKGETPATAINRLIFNKEGLLSNEFDQLFISLFGDDGIHKNIIELLAKHRYGLTRETILSKLKLTSSGWFSNILFELETSGFIEIQVPYSKKTKDALIKVIDNYCLFFEAFKKNKSVINWDFAQSSQRWKIWSGLTFENICFYHQKKIVQSLGLSGIQVAVYSWHHKGNHEMKGAQIDMIIERADKAINICEIKYNEKPFIITKAYAKDVKMKMTAFDYFTKNKKTLFCTFVTLNGIVNNAESNHLIQSSIEINNLF
jgi:uncharacterized protein